MQYAVIEAYRSLPAMLELTRSVELATPSARSFADRAEKVKDVSPKLFAIVGVGASAYSVFFGILPLLQAGLLVPAAVIIRSLLERVANIAWLSKGTGDTYKVFSEQWDDRTKRPYIKDRIRFLDNYIGDKLQTEEFKFSVSEHLNEEWLDILHSYTHGDHSQMHRNSTHDESFSYFAAGPDPLHADMCSSLAKLSVILLGQLHRELELAMPDVGGDE